jgi:TolA-binding protein
MLTLRRFCFQATGAAKFGVSASNKPRWPTCWGRFDIENVNTRTAGLAESGLTLSAAQSSGSVNLVATVDEDQPRQRGFTMQTNRRPQFHFKAITMATLLAFLPLFARCQNSTTAPASVSPELADDIRALVTSVNHLQSQVETLNLQMSELRNAQRDALREAEQLRVELNETREQLAAKPGSAPALDVARPATSQASSASVPSSSSSSSGASATLPPQVQSAYESSKGDLQQRISKLEDDQELMNDKIIEQSQTKVESGSKYRVRLSGLVLLNTAVTRGSVDNLDIPQIAVPPEAPGVRGSFSGSLRQSQIGIETFGPDIAGARTSANVKFDFAGGFPNAPNGAAFGVVRLRTGTVRLDWADTSIIAGQDAIFFAPLTPTTLASIAIPALSYTGNLWSWTPQVRIEHRFALSENSGLRIQAGILDSLTGNAPQQSYRYPSVGEASGQPAYATHIGYSRRFFGRDLNIGIGGYYGRQNWAFGRAVDGWAGVTDVTVPLGELLDFSAEFYRGRAVGGLGGGIGQSILLSGPIYNPGTAIYGLDSTGGWLQLKFKPRPNFEVNFAYGQDQPFARELKLFPASALYYGYSISRNQSPFVNFIYRARSDVLFSMEYKRLQTNALNNNTYIANQLIMSLGYAF